VAAAAVVAMVMILLEATLLLEVAAVGLNMVEVEDLELTYLLEQTEVFQEE